MSELSIRDARVSDAPTLTAFNVALAFETEHKRLDPAVVGRGVQRVLSSPQVARYFVAERGGKVVGQTMINYEITDWRDGYVWWIHSVYVPEEWRGHGVFKALFAHIEALARKDGNVRNLRLFVEYDNVKAQGTYERLGMEREKYHIYDKTL